MKIGISWANDDCSFCCSEKNVHKDIGIITKKPQTFESVIVNGLFRCGRLQHTLYITYPIGTYTISYSP